ncbi:DUF2478 domain-containing protein [Methylovirgula sp. 4M-Z18]|uniref:DUF2478 domain-containing protein n=1 Tax=Methylovirgula sp. 4M-Z18 TaxID=2293567 RepID=UPI001313DE13|nr:DUF2478 domain-containing protein [Methylovirgula sp. 4M-Z18]
MQIADRIHPITAIVYSDGGQFEALLQEVTAAMTEHGMRLAGLLQRSEPKPDRLKCDMHLQDLATGELHRISDDRGPHARGCVLNTDRLLRACATAEAGLSSRTDLMILCKFGKTEVEGGGFRTLIANALDLSVRVLIGVPSINLTPFREFSAGLTREIAMSELGSDGLAAARHLWPDLWLTRRNGGARMNRPLEKVPLVSPSPLVSGMNGVKRFAPLLPIFER